MTPKDLNAGLTADSLRAVLHYDAESGVFTWATARSGISVGDIAGHADVRTGYCRITIDGRRFLAHRLAWLYVHGSWPASQLDHINQIRNDNRISNLREATNAENLQNKKLYANNSSGVRGVHREGNKWRASIRTGGRLVNLGLFHDLADAAAARRSAEATLHPFAAREVT